jgi:pilus assembly protein CpaB
MNRKRLLFIGVLSLLLAGFVSLVIYRLLQASLASAHEANTSVVVAMSDLAVGQKLEEKDLRLIKMPGADLPQGVFYNIADVVGRGVVLPITKNELVLNSKLAPDKAGAGMPAVIPPGMRAVSVRVNDVVGVAGFVAPGTRVDVILTGNPTRDNDPANVITTTVLENVQVLAAGAKMQNNENGQPEQVPVMTLLVSPDDAQKLTLAANEGRIQLSLRNPLDVTRDNPPIIKNAQLYHMATTQEVKEAKKEDQKKKAEKAKRDAVPPPSSVYVVEMIRGDKRDTTKF